MAKNKVIDGESRSFNTIRNIIVGFIYKFINILMPFLIRTVIIKVLGQEYLGLNTLFTSIFMFLNLAEFGIASALTYKMYKPAQEKDYDMLSFYASVIRKAYKLIGVVLLVLGLLILPFLPHFISGDCPDGVNIYILYLIYMANTVIPYLGTGYCTSIFTAFQRLDIVNSINAGITLFLNICQIIVVMITAQYYWYIILLPCFTIINNALLFYLKNKYFKQIYVNKKVNRETVKEIFTATGALFGHRLNYVVVSSADNIVISSFLGLAVLAQYGNYYIILSAVIGIIDILIQACLPSIGNYIAEKSKQEVQLFFRNISFLTYWITGWCAICLVCLYQPFMKMWMGDNMLLPMSSVFLFAVYLYSYKARAAIILFKDAAGEWEIDWLKPYVSAGVNIIINIALVKVIGLNGVIISTIVVFAFINFPWESQAILKVLEYKNRMEYYVTFLTHLFITIWSAIITYYVCEKFVFLPSVAEFMVRATICVLIPNFIYLLLFYNRPEFRYFKNKICELINKN